MKTAFGIGMRESLHRLPFALFALLAMALLSDCADPGGPSFVTLGVDMESGVARFGGTGGTSTIPSRPADLCVRLPVLLGSRVDKRHGVTTGLAVEIKATRDGAEVTFPGAINGDTTRSYRFGELQLGVREIVTVSIDFVDYEATIATGCTNP